MQKIVTIRDEFAQFHCVDEEMDDELETIHSELGNTYAMTAENSARDISIASAWRIADRLKVANQWCPQIEGAK